MKTKISDINSTRTVQTQLGIVGGGQLARMLALEAAPLGLQVQILSEKTSDPAAQVAQQWKSGSPASKKDVLEFCKGLDYITFESEFFDMASFKEAQETHPHLQIFPKPEVMQILQDRGSQKLLLQKHKVPTAPFLAVQSREDLKKAFTKFPQGFVLKKCRGGYDGNGTYYCRTEKDLHKLEALFPESFIAEAFIEFRRELAQIFVRSKEGSCIALPLVQTEQKQSRCDWVLGPVLHRESAKYERQIKKILQSIDYVGAVGFEFFDTRQGLLVNEIAPRVHNSGHYSQQALSHSQFLLHLQAGLGQKLVTPAEYARHFCMVNLVGESQNPVRVPLAMTGTLHWYGKQENRVGRKMGHVNYLGTSAASLLKKALLERKKFNL
jgi:5-(carboxyamino)imidazole ribonucleotide synthase